jgi:hypothetical protein
MSQQIQAQFVRSAKKPGCNMIKVVIQGRKAEGEWADCPWDVKNFADKNFQEGEQVILTADFANNKYNVSRIERVGGSPQGEGYQAPATTAPATSAPAIDTPPVSQPAPVTNPIGNISPPKQYMNPKTPEESAQIMRLSVYASACEAVTALTGQVDVNSICDVIDMVYQRGLTRVQQ